MSGHAFRDDGIFCIRVYEVRDAKRGRERVRWRVQSYYSGHRAGSETRSHFSKVEDAEKCAAMMWQDYLQGLHAAPVERPATLQDLIDRFCAREMSKKGKQLSSASTLHSYPSQLQALVRVAGADLPVEHLAKKHVEAIIRLVNLRTGKPLSRMTTDSYLRATSALVQWALVEGFLTADITDKVRFDAGPVVVLAQRNQDRHAVTVTQSPAPGNPTRIGRRKRRQCFVVSRGCPRRPRKSRVRCAGSAALDCRRRRGPRAPRSGAHELRGPSPVRGRERKCLPCQRLRRLHHRARLGLGWDVSRLSPQLACLCKLLISRGKDRLSTPGQHIVGRHVANGAVQPHAVVVRDVARQYSPRLLDCLRASWSNRLAFHCLVPPLNLAVRLWVVRRCAHMGHARLPNELLEVLGDKLRPVVRDDPRPRLRMFLARHLQDALDVGFCHTFADFPVHNGPAGAVEHRAEVVESAAQVQVRDVDMPMFMRMYRLHKAGALLARAFVPSRQQAGLR